MTSLWLACQTHASRIQQPGIALAQDFQDLTGPVIKKMMDMVKGIEHERVSFLIAYSTNEKKVGLTLNPELLHGLVVTMRKGAATW